MGLIDKPAVTDHAPARTGRIHQQRREALYSPKQHHVIDLDATLDQELLEVPVRQTEPQIRRWTTGSPQAQTESQQTPLTPTGSRDWNGGGRVADLLKLAALLVLGVVISRRFLADILPSGFVFAAALLLAACRGREGDVGQLTSTPQTPRQRLVRTHGLRLRSATDCSFSNPS